jgi:hypothetical protein
MVSRLGEPCKTIPVDHTFSAGQTSLIAWRCLNMRTKEGYDDKEFLQNFRTLQE